MRNIEGNSRAHRIARAVLLAIDKQLYLESGSEVQIEVAQTSHGVTIECELPNNERWHVMVTGKEVLLGPGMSPRPPMEPPAEVRS